MKVPFILVILFWTLGLTAQNFDLIGTNDHPVLNKEEVKLLNSLLQETRDTFDFKDKKVAFITGPGGSTITPKSDYFKGSVLPWVEDGARPQISMIILTKDEKEKYGGYDVLVLSWVKVYTKRAHRNVLKALEQKNE